MEENKNVVKEEAVKETSAADTVIKGLQAKLKNAVTKEEYDKLAEENKMLADTILNGQQSQEEQKHEPTQEELIKRHRELINSLKDQSLSDVEQVSNLIEANDILEQLTGVHGEAGINGETAPTVASVLGNVKDTLKEWCEDAGGHDGDNAVFLAKCQSNIVDKKII